MPIWVKTFVVSGDRIAQLVPAKVVKCKFSLVAELPETSVEKEDSDIPADKHTDGECEMAVVIILLSCWQDPLPACFGKDAQCSLSGARTCKGNAFSLALQELVANAGGIYLSLVLLVSFLNIEVAQKWDIFGLSMEPLAFLSIVFTIIQPALLKIYRTVRGN